MKNKITKALIILVIICVTITAVELGSILIYPTITKKPFSRKDIQSKLVVKSTVGDINNTDIPQYQKNHILHPYLGFVANPKLYPLDWEFSRNNSNTVINEHGFLGEGPLVKKQENSVTIAILGGSFAMNFYLDSKEMLEKELNKLPQFNNKEIKLVSIAMSGYKQPQQLLALNYFLSLGGEYDIVINLDGFNEVALPFSEMHTHTYPFFPRMWYLYSSKMLDVQCTRQFSHLIELNQKQQKMKDKFSDSRMSCSNFVLVLWEILDTKLGSQINRQSEKLETMMSDMLEKSKDRNYERSGPLSPTYTSRDDFFEQMAVYWARCSVQMNFLAKANGFDYFHFLQPNQYLKNSKKLTKQEQEQAYYDGDDYGYKAAVEFGYPFLLTHGEKLVEQNVNFTDLTMIYAQTTETVYEDMCCHVDKIGNNIIAKEIAATIGDHYQQHIAPVVRSISAP